MIPPQPSTNISQQPKPTITTSQQPQKQKPVIPQQPTKPILKQQPPPTVNQAPPPQKPTQPQIPAQPKPPSLTQPPNTTPSTIAPINVPQIPKNTASSTSRYTSDALDLPKQPSLKRSLSSPNFAENLTNLNKNKPKTPIVDRGSKPRY